MNIVLTAIGFWCLLCSILSYIVILNRSGERYSNDRKALHRNIGLYLIAAAICLKGI